MTQGVFRIQKHGMQIYAMRADKRGMGIPTWVGLRWYGKWHDDILCVSTDYVGNPSAHSKCWSYFSAHQFCGKTSHEIGKCNSWFLAHTVRGQSSEPGHSTYSPKYCYVWEAVSIYISNFLTNYEIMTVIHVVKKCPSALRNHNVHHYVHKSLKIDSPEPVQSNAHHHNSP
jgi:hypothetical protein